MHSFALSARISKPVVKTERIMHRTDFSHTLDTIRPNLRDLHRDLDYEDFQSLKKQRSDVLSDIALLTDENVYLRRKLDDAIRARDEEELAEIEVYNKTVTDREMGYHESRVFTGSKRLLELQEEMKRLDKRLEKLSLDYSADVEHKLKVYICMQRNDLHNLTEELNEFDRGIDFTREELDGDSLAEAKEVFHEQRNVIRGMKKKLRRLREREKELEVKAEKLQPEPVSPEEQEREVADLKRRYGTLVRVRRARERNCEELQSLFEKEKANAEKERERRRERRERREKARREREKQEEETESSESSETETESDGSKLSNSEKQEEETKEEVMGSEKCKEEQESSESLSEEEEERKEDADVNGDQKNGGGRIVDVVVTGFRHGRGDQNLRIEDPDVSDSGDEAEDKDHGDP